MSATEFFSDERVVASDVTKNTEVLKPCTRLRDHVVSISEWWQHHQSSNEPTRLLDLRSENSHLEHQIVVPKSQQAQLVVARLPAGELTVRSFELPARHVEFSILLHEQDMKVVESVLLGVKLGVRKRPFHPWKVTHVLLDAVGFWREAHQLGISARKNLPLDAVPGPTFPLPRLWQPDPMVETILLPLIVHEYMNKRPSVLQILDLASGAGRDAAFLAEELCAAGMKNFQVMGIDHRYNGRETQIVNDFWERRGVGNCACSLKLSLSELETLKESTSLRDGAVLFAVRFCKPELVKEIAADKSVHIFALSHFCKPYSGAPWNFEHPSEKTVIDRDELSTVFRAEWEIVNDEITKDSDHGRTMIHFVARRQR